MGYDINFKVKVEGIDKYITVGDCEANITWNVREMITKSTGLKWNNEANNGLVKDIIPAIQKGYNELTNYPEKYKQYEAENGWGTVKGCKNFFWEIIKAWDAFQKDYYTRDLVDVATFWIT